MNAVTFDRIAPAIIADRMQRLMNVADQMDGEFQSVLLLLALLAANVIPQPFQFGDDAIARGLTGALPVAVETVLRNGNVHEMPIFATGILIAVSVRPAR